MKCKEYIVKMVQCEKFQNLFESSAIAKQCYMRRCNARNYCSAFLDNDSLLTQKYRESSHSVDYFGTIEKATLCKMCIFIV